MNEYIKLKQTEDLVPGKCIYTRPPVAKAAVHSKVVVLLLLIYCLFLHPIVCVGSLFCLALVLLFSTLCPSSFAVILMGKRELVALL